MSGAATAQPIPGAEERALSGVERSALRKATWRLVPLLTIAYLVAYLDRNCIGFAALQMNKDLGLTNADFGLAAGFFFISYTLLEVPSNMALYRFGARRWIARIMISWGLVSAAMALVSGPYSLFGIRFILGIAEAGFFPGVTYYLAAWFPREYRTRVIAWFLVAIPGSSLVGGPISGLLLQLDGTWGLAGWKWLFLGVSVPAILLGFAVLRILSDKPEDTSWLTRDEAEAIRAMRAAETFDRPKSSLVSALSDRRVMMFALVQFGFTLGSYGLGIWLPLIMQSYKLSNLEIGFLTFPIYLVASAAMILWAWHADRTGRKIGNMTAALGLAVVGMLAFVFSRSPALSLLLITVAIAGVTAARGIFWAIPPRILTGAGAAAGLAFINSIGTFGGFAGPYLMGVFKDATGGFVYGVLVMAGIMVATTALSASLKLTVRGE